MSELRIPGSGSRFRLFVLALAVATVTTCARVTPRGSSTSPDGGSDSGGFSTSPDGGSDSVASGDRGGTMVPSDCEAARRNGSAQGCDFYAIAPAARYAGSGLVDTIVESTCFAVMVANTGMSTIEITVEYDGAKLDIAKMGRTPRGFGAALAYDPLPGDKLTPGQMAILFLSGGGKLPCPAPTGIATDPSAVGTSIGRSFHITTSAPVIAYDIFPYGGAAAATASATLLIPTSAWGINYIAADGYRRDSMGLAATDQPWLQIAAAEDATEVIINPTTPIVGGAGVAPTGANQPRTYRLTRGQVLQLKQDEELTGSAIQSNKPIGLWGGSACMHIPLGELACDGAHQQLVPVNLLGSEYVAVRYRDRLSGVRESVPWTMVGAVDGTALTYDPAPPVGAPATINRGQTIEFNAVKAFSVRSSDDQHPFYLAGHMTGGTMAGNIGANGDPETVNTVPPTRWLNSYLFITDPTYGTTNLVFVRRKTLNGQFDDVTLDCFGPLTSWQPIGSDGLYQFAHLDLVAAGKPNGRCDNGVHTARSNSPFGLTVWGWDPVVSYAYPAGMSVRPVNSVIVVP